MNYTVNLWDTHPDDGEDTCAIGADFATEAEARACVANLRGTFPRSYKDSPWVQLDGPGVHEVTRNPDAVAREPEGDDEWRREQAMQAGMAFGCEGYNEAMGYD